MKNIKKQKGITLIALVITIIVMLILVGVTISMSLNGKLFGYAKKAVVDTNNQKKAEEELTSGKVTINGKEYASIQDYLNNKTQTSEEKLTLVKSWTCSNGGAWSEAIPAGEKVEGDIIANLYKTGNKLDLTEEISLDLYKLVIEGTGRMGTLFATGEFVQGYAWQKNLRETIDAYDKLKENKLDISTVDFSQISDGPLIEAVEIKEGITNIPSGAFCYGWNIAEFKMADSIINIGEWAFYQAVNLKSIKLSKGLKNIENRGLLLMRSYRIGNS